MADSSTCCSKVDLRPGISVQIHGLHLRPELHGAMGFLIKFDTKTKRWGVELLDGSGAKSLTKNQFDGGQQMHMCSIV